MPDWARTMSIETHLAALAGYPPEVIDQVRSALAGDRLRAWLLGKYPEPHAVRTDKALFVWVDNLRVRYLKKSPPLARVCYDGKLQQVRQALGTHARIPRMQGSKISTRREIRVAGLFRQAPEAFLRMIVAHELAHLREPDHDKAFYQLCCHIEPDYHQLEFEVRAWLCQLSFADDPLW